MVTMAGWGCETSSWPPPTRTQYEEEVPDLRIQLSKVFNTSSEVVKITIGTKPRKVFVVHKNVIAVSSEFLGDMGVDKKDEMDLSYYVDSVEADVFKIYLHWLYYGTLPVQRPPYWGDDYDEYLQIAKAHKLGKDLWDKGFQDATLDAFLAKANSEAKQPDESFSGGDAICYLYNNTKKDSQARLLLVDIFMARRNSEYLREAAVFTELPPEFVRDVAVAALNEDTSSFNQIAQRCKYHSHGKNQENCYLRRMASEGKGPLAIGDQSI